MMCVPWDREIIVQRPAAGEPRLLEVTTLDAVDGDATTWRRYRLVEDGQITTGERSPSEGSVS